MCRSLACLLMLPVLAVATPTSAQSPLADDEKAVGAFEVYLDRLTSSSAAKASGAGDALPVDQMGMDPNEIRRIYGAASAPKDIAAIENRQGSDPLAMNFFIRIQFNSEDGAQKAFQQMQEKGKPETINGKEYYRPADTETETPSNMLAHMVSPDVIEIGTDGFVLHDTRYVFSDHLMDAWKKMPKAAIRIAADLDGVRHLIDQGMQAAQAQGGIPPAAMPAVAMVENTAALRIALDFSSNNMLWLTFTGKDDAATGTIKATFDGFLAMGKGMGQQMLPAIPSDNMKKVAGEMLAALQTTQAGTDVNLVLPRPEGFEQAVTEMVPMIMGAMMGGMGGPGGPGGPGADPFGGGGEDPFGAPPADGAGEDPFGGDPFGN